MRFLCTAFMLLVSLVAIADEHDRLWNAAGWPQQREHFNDALQNAQQSYRANLPPAVFQALVDNSNRRFAPADIDRRARTTLRQTLTAPQSALQFFESPLGRKVVDAEVTATRADQLRKNAGGLPHTETSATRRLLIRHLAQALPAREAGAEVSLALAGMAADSLSQMLPGLLGGGQSQAMLNSQRARLMEQMGENLDDTLQYVYRDLSDPELEEFLNFAQSPAGQAYYQAAIAALRAGLAVGQPATAQAPVSSSI
jgi:hypothetical protein